MSASAAVLLNPGNVLMPRPAKEPLMADICAAFRELGYPATLMSIREPSSYTAKANRPWTSREGVVVMPVVPLPIRNQLGAVVGVPKPGFPQRLVVTRRPFALVLEEVELTATAATAVVVLL